MKKMTRNDLLFLCIIVLVHVVFFRLALHFQRIYMGDSHEYIYEALNIKNHLFFYSGSPAMPVQPEFMTQRQPLYPLLLMTVYLFAVNNWIVLVIQNLLSIGNIYFMRKMLFRLSYQEKQDRILLLLVIAYPAQFINANTIAPDILLQTCTLAYCACFVSFIYTSAPKYCLYMSLWLVAGMMVKPVLYPFALMHIILLVVAALSLKARLLTIANYAMIPVVAILLYCSWNYHRTGLFLYTSNKAFNAIHFNYVYIKDVYGIDSSNHFLQHERDTIATMPSFGSRYVYANKRGAAILKSHFVPYMVYHLKNSLRIFLEPGKSEMDLFTGYLTYGRLYKKENTGFYAILKEHGWGAMPAYVRHNPSIPFVLFVFFFNCLRAIGLICFFYSRRTHWLLRLFIFVLLAYFAVAAGPIANTRYFLPVSLIAIGAGALGLQISKTFILKYRDTLSRQE
jgi:hypothetical protein